VASQRTKDRPGEPSKLGRKLSTGQRVAIACACIAAFGTIVGSTASSLISRSPSSTPHHNGRKRRSPRVDGSVSLPTFENAFVDINSSRPKVRDQGVADFGFLYPRDSPSGQWGIIGILVQYVRDYAPAVPNSADFFAYCNTQPPLIHPRALTEALTVIGSRDNINARRPINLSNLNLAYVKLDGLSFTNVNFDSDLLCRTTFYSDSFRGSSFVGADLRFTRIRIAQGLTVGELRAAESLCKAILPRDIAASKPIEYLINVDRPFCY
jgi:hypothetical protein